MVPSQADYLQSDCYYVNKAWPTFYIPQSDMRVLAIRAHPQLHTSALYYRGHHPGVRNESSPATPQVLSHYVETQGKWKLRGVGKAGSKRSKNLRSDAFPQLPKLIYFAHRKNKSKLKIID